VVSSRLVWGEDMVKDLRFSHRTVMEGKVSHSEFDH
jgi:hypothetical protein